MAPDTDEDLTRAVEHGATVTRDVAEAVTRLPSSPGVAPAPATVPRLAPQDALAPGAIVAGRYRLVSLLGRGGMGEVYRADDLTLDQPVALKFLSQSVAAGDARLGRLHNELRVARQVSHKNVCRLHDVGEANGRRFLTMEYVDGEDLSSSLRRIGRIPQDKAIEIARQLCAGLAASHERGVLHRDLKPANVMLDGQGNVRITDFGIATAVGDDGHELVGTPQYLAPELFAGRAASVRSDLYALGLVLFEVFTGRRAVESKTLGELKAFHQTGTVTTPTSIVHDLDPLVERAILRCLDRDPDRRPASALAVAAALPGADPLAAALAAGETPSPEILAAAGEVEAIAVAPGLGAVAFAVIGLLAFAALSARSSMVGRVPLDLPPDVLVDRAQQVVAALGYTGAVGDSAYEFTRHADYTRWLFQTRGTPDRYDPVSAGTPSAVLFSYRSSPRDLQPRSGARVTQVDPPFTETEMRSVVLDGRGRLQEFRSVPPQRDSSAAAPTSPPWDRAFVAAGLDFSAFTPGEPDWTPRDYADIRAAWEGPLPDSQGTRVRVEAGAYRGRPVYFTVVGPWTRPTVMQPTQPSFVDRVIIAALTAVVAILFVVAGMLARRNFQAGRADRRGAARLAFFAAVTGLLGWFLDAHHVANVAVEYGSLSRAAARTAFTSILLWATYVALEPYVRRLWPDSLLGWSRLLAGHVRDPRVGRDVLLGVATGVAVSLVDLARATLIPWLGYSAPSPTYGLRVNMLAGAGVMSASWLEGMVGAVLAALMLLLVVVLIRLALRRPWLVIPITVVLLGLLSMREAGTTTTLLVLVFGVVTGALFTGVLFRVGLLAFAVAWFVWQATSDVPIVPDITHWSAAAGNWTIAALVALVLFGFYAARAGQPLFVAPSKAS